MQEKQNNIKVIDAETLMDKRLPPTKFCVDTLLPQGLCILGGAPKVGKSWFVLDLCTHVARGDEFLGLSVARGKVLYLCLEDSERRIQERLNTITADVPEGLYFAMGEITMESGICDFLRKCKQKCPELTLIVIDTFQLIQELRKEKARQTELKRVMGRAYIDEYDDYVCTDALGRLYDPDYITNHFKVILRKNKLRDIRFHELRHSCASLLLAKGIPMKMIQDWLGHSDMATTANIYSHIDSASKKETAQAIGELLG